MTFVEIPEKPAGMTNRMVSNLARSQESTPRDKTEQILDAHAAIWGGEDELAGLAVVRAILDELILAEVRELRDEDCEDGHRSWAEIGASLGISKQAAQQRYRI